MLQNIATFVQVWSEAKGNLGEFDQQQLLTSTDVTEKQDKSECTAEWSWYICIIV